MAIDKRYQVFVSSTYADLTEERSEVIQALLELDCIPAGMELFPASDDTQWDIIKKVIDDCDYYVLILAGRYGSLNKDGISYTEMEYDYAVEKGIPIIAFLHEDPENIPNSKCEKTTGGKKKLEDFKIKAKGKLCKFWTSPAELGSVVSRSLIQLIKHKPGVGWVKADLVPTAEASSEILRLKEKLEEFESKQRHKPKEIENLQQGDDVVELEYEFTKKESKKDEEDTFSFTFRQGETWTGKFSVSWNDLFKKICPLMIDEASEGVLKDSLHDLVAKQMYKKLKEKYPNDTVSNFKLKTDSFHTVIIQFRALKLIEKSDRKRKIDDTFTYWKLTEFGDEQMTLLRAIKK